MTAKRETEELDAFGAVSMMMESGTSPMSGVGLEIFKIPTGYKGDFVEDLYHALLKTDVVAPFDQVLHWNSRRPLKSYWEKVDEIDMPRHIKRHVLPKPGGMEELLDVVEMLTSFPLDRSQPLWECHLISGLKGRRFAICGKSHHAMLDGTTAMARIVGSKSTDPKNKTVRGYWSTIPGIHDRAKQAKHQDARNLTDTVAEMMKQSVRASKQYVGIIEDIVRDVGVAKFVRDNLLPSAPGSLPFNIKGDFGKSVAAVTLPVSGMKSIAKARSGTLNDVFLAVVSGGLYDYLEQNDELPDTHLVAQVPMNLREPGDLEAGNKITTIFVNLGEPADDKPGRLASIIKDTGSKKKIARQGDKRALIAYTLLTAGVGAVTSLFPEQTQTANVTVSNVPGSRKPLYVMGAKMECSYAFNVLPPGVSLIIVGFTYCDSMDIALVAHRSAIPDLDLVAERMAETFQELFNTCA